MMKQIFLFFFLFLVKFHLLSVDNICLTKTSKKCAFAHEKIDIFYKSCQRDHEWLMLSIRTVDYFARGFRKVIIVTDEDHDLNLEDFGEIKNVEIIIKKVAIPNHFSQLDRYNHQQYVKLDFMKWTDADAVLTIDSDTILLSVLTPDIFYAEPLKPRWFLQRYSEIMNNDKSPIWKSLLCWRKVVGHFVQKSPEKIEYEFMRAPGFILTKAMSYKLQEYVRNRFNQTLYDFFLTPSVASNGKHSEFNYWGAFAFYIDPNHDYIFTEVKAFKQNTRSSESYYPNNFPATLKRRTLPYPLYQFNSIHSDIEEAKQAVDNLISLHPSENKSILDY